MQARSTHRPRLIRATVLFSKTWPDFQIGTSRATQLKRDRTSPARRERPFLYCTLPPQASVSLLHPPSGSVGASTSSSCREQPFLYCTLPPQASVSLLHPPSGSVGSPTSSSFRECRCLHIKLPPGGSVSPLHPPSGRVGRWSGRGGKPGQTVPTQTIRSQLSPHRPREADSPSGRVKQRRA